MTSMERLRAYARQNGQECDGQLRLTPRQTRRYYKKRRQAAAKQGRA